MPADIPFLPVDQITATQIEHILRYSSSRTATSCAERKNRTRVSREGARDPQR